MAQTPIEPPALNYRFFDTQSDGAGGLIFDPGGSLTPHVGGGELHETHSIQPPPPLQTTITHVKVFSNATGTSFWGSVVSPSANSPPAAGENIGGGVTLTVGTKFRKDSETAFVEFEITKVRLFGAGPLSHPMNNIGLIGQLSFVMDAFDPSGPRVGGGLAAFQTDAITARLDGRPGNFAFHSNNISIGVTSGGLGESFIEISLLETKTLRVDLSRFAVGDEFGVTYSMRVETMDTIQNDTTIQAFGHDPLAPGTGVTLSLNDVTLLGPFFVPEPGTLTLLGAAGLGFVFRRRRSASAA